MNRFKVYTLGEAFMVTAHHFTINEEAGVVEFYKSETEKDDKWIVFLSGVAAIQALDAPLPMTVARLRL